MGAESQIRVDVQLTVTMYMGIQTEEVVIKTVTVPKSPGQSPGCISLTQVSGEISPDHSQTIHIGRVIKHVPAVSLLC